MFGPSVEGWAPFWDLLWWLHLVGGLLQALVILLFVVGLVLALRDGATSGRLRRGLGVEGGRTG